MKFSVGFQLYDEGEDKFSRIVETYKDAVSEVFFPWQDVATGRSPAATRHGYTDWTAQERTEAELRALRDLGVKLDVLFNGNCYGAYAMSEKLANTVISVLDHLKEIGCGADVVTTASPAVAHTVKKHFPEIEVRASVNMRIGTVKGMAYLADLFDSFHVQREYNRDLDHLARLRAWADGAGKKLILLANSGCFIHCSAQTFHDNMVSHEAEICEVKNLPDFMPYLCRRVLKDRENWHMLLENTWIRPEDLHHYEGLVDAVKLATRMHALPGMVIDAYARGSFIGNLLDLCEPGLGGAIAPYVINNAAFPADWFEKTTACDKRCETCSYCRSVLDQVLLNTREEA